MSAKVTVKSEGRQCAACVLTAASVRMSGVKQSKTESSRTKSQMHLTNVSGMLRGSLYVSVR